MADIDELMQIKKLLILALIRSGASSEEIALATGMGASTIRRMFPMGRIKGSPTRES